MVCRVFFEELVELVNIRLGNVSQEISEGSFDEASEDFFDEDFSGDDIDEEPNEIQLDPLEGDPFDFLITVLNR